MEKSGKKDILAIVIAFALFTAFITAFAAIKSAAELLDFTTYRGSSELYSGYTDLQKPLALMMLFSVFFSFAGVAAGTVALASKRTFVKKLSVAAVALTATVITVFLIVAYGDFMSLYKEVNSNAFEYGKPYYLLSGFADEFALYSTASSVLMSLLAVFVATALLLAGYLILTVKEEKKKAVAAESTALPQTAETEKGVEAEPLQTEPVKDEPPQS